MEKTKIKEERLFRHHLGERLPFVIGVSGHIDADPAALAALKPEILKQLRAWREALPSTPFVFFSSMARGADWYVARLVREAEIGAQLVVPLPFSWDLYRKDFAEAEAADLDAFLNADETVAFELPLLPGVSAADIAGKKAARADQYALAGAFIARNCHVLLALWDGEAGKPGGTADVVNFKLEGVPEKFLNTLGADVHTVPGDGLELGPVYHFPIARSGSGEKPASGAAKRKPRVLFPRSFDYESADEAERFFDERIFHPVEDFNSLTGAASDAASGLLPKDDFDAAVPDDIRESLAYLERLAARADRLAVKFAGHTRRTLLAMSAFVGLAAFCFDISGDLAKFHSLHHYVQLGMLGFPVFFIVAFLLHLVAKQRRYQDRHQDYRALAEGLRVQFFWQLGGVPDSVASHYLGQQRAELYWIRRACVAARTFPPCPPEPLNAERAGIVERHWIENQHDYFLKKSQSDESRLEMFELITGSFFMYSIGAILLIALMEFESVRHVLPKGLRPVGEGLAEHSNIIHIGFALSAVMAGVIAALCHNAAQKLALSYHVKQYLRMERIFRLSLKRFRDLVKSGKLAEAQGEMRLLGEAALAENGDWVLAHRDRPLEVPHH